jgi:FtsP/CotA-like multicopper oxidase with cupredoxin domain
LLTQIFTRDYRQGGRATFDTRTPYSEPASVRNRTELCRREFLRAAACAAGAPTLFGQQSSPADLTLRIGPVSVDVAPRKTIKTIGYNGAVPGPVLRLTEGRPVTVDVFNSTSEPELVHWHGLAVPSDVDGSMEEGTPHVPPNGSRRYTFTPRPSGTRWYHTHTLAGRNLHRATYSGQFGALIVTPREDPARYDAESILVLHGWDPYFTTMGDGSLEVAYNNFTVNGRSLASGEPVRVKEGQRVLFRIVNADATLTHRLALSGHSMSVVALDGNRVPQSRAVDAIKLAPAERADVLVLMNRPGIWVFGDIDDKTRKNGLGVVVEYASRSGQPQWQAPPAAPWDYTLFGGAGPAPEPDAQVPLIFKPHWMGNRWIDHWTINGKEFPHTDPIRVKGGGLYRLIFDNQSDDAHPVHLHRHAFELVRIAGKPTAGILKDVVLCPPRQKVEVQFRADNPGPTLFHCHQQLHMDFGFMAMVEYEPS